MYLFLIKLRVRYNIPIPIERLAKNIFNFSHFFFILYNSLILIKLTTFLSSEMIFIVRNHFLLSLSFNDKNQRISETCHYQNYKLKHTFNTISSF